MTGVVGHESSNRDVQVIIGVDTHQDQHVAVAIDQRGVRLDEKHVPVATCGYEELEQWSRNLGQVHAFGIEGTGSYGAGLARFLTSRNYTVVEINRPDRSVRRRKGKSDATDAEMAARAVLSGIADAIPKSGEGEVEMIRMLKSTKDSAVKARTQAINQIKALAVTAPSELRETLDGLTTAALITRCKGLRSGRLDDPKAAAKYALRSLACRYRQLNEEVQELETELERLISGIAPVLVSAFGVGPDTAAALLVAAVRVYDHALELRATPAVVLRLRQQVQVELHLRDVRCRLVKGGAMKDHRGGEKLCLSHKFAANCRGDDRYGIELTISAIDVIPSGF